MTWCQWKAWRARHLLFSETWDYHQHTRKDSIPRSLSRASPIDSLEKPTWWWPEKKEFCVKILQFVQGVQPQFRCLVLGRSVQGHGRLRIGQPGQTSAAAGDQLHRHGPVVNQLKLPPLLTLLFLSLAATDYMTWESTKHLTCFLHRPHALRGDLPL